MVFYVFNPSADTLATVTKRGATTTIKSTFSGGIKGLGTLLYGAGGVSEGVLGYANVRLGCTAANDSGRAIFEDNAGFVWEIDVLADVFRWYKVGDVFMTLGATGLEVMHSGVTAPNVVATSDVDAQDTLLFHNARSNDSDLYEFRDNAGNSPVVTIDASDDKTTVGTLESRLGMGYGTGGTVTQLTDKSTAVTINYLWGTITMHNATLNAATMANFTVNCNKVGANDVVVVFHIATGTPTRYNVVAHTIAANSFSIGVRNITATNYGDALVLRYMIFKNDT